MNDYTITPRPGPTLGKDTLGVCAWILRQRKALGLSQHALCEAASVPRSSLCRYEAGEHLPTLPTLVRLAEAMGHDLTLRGIVPLTPKGGHPYKPS